MLDFKAKRTQLFWCIAIQLCVVGCVFIALNSYADSPSTSRTQEPQSAYRVGVISIVGNKTVPAEAIKARIPYRTGSAFVPQRSSEVIKSIYSMGYFKPYIKITAFPQSDASVDLEIAVQEKELANEITFEGTDAIKQTEIEKAVALSDLYGVDHEDIQRISEQIKNLYKSKDYHNIAVTSRTESAEEGKLRTVFVINEGCPTYVRRIFFQGNTCVSSKTLKKLIFTREQWLLGFLTKAGTYQPDALNYDKYLIEDYYRSNGFLKARVEDIEVVPDPEDPNNLRITYIIHEGDIYRVSGVSAEGNDLLSEEEILARIDIRPGDLYSSEKIRQSLERLRLLWGEYGYIFAENDIDMQPDEDCKTVTLRFSSKLGCPVTSNRITIVGNQKTREHVIRRELSVTEGQLLTNRALDESKERVERLGYFDPRNGVNWNINRLNDTQADLELILKETTTGKFYVDFKLGGDIADIQSPARSAQIGFGAQDTNFRGTGIRYNASGYVSWQDYQIALNLIDPWLFNRPLQGGFNLFHRKSLYNDFRHVTQTPQEHLTGGSFTLGFNTELLGGLSCLFDIGVEDIRFSQRIRAQVPLDRRELAQDFQKIIDKLFESGLLLWSGVQVIQDYRNNVSIPTRGYLWSTALKIGIPNGASDFGFVKWDLDAHWYTPLINEYDLIFHLHGHMGIVNEIGNRLIPYRELYHIGGPSSVRGFLFGQIGPTLFGDSIGAKKAFWMNAEVLFPVTKDFNIVGLVFYDGGAGWDNPFVNDIRPGLVKNNEFHFRQAIGIGVKVRQPTPISIALGLKLDRNKRTGESISEFHFSSVVDF